jgi:hypothetical protein
MGVVSRSAQRSAPDRLEHIRFIDHNGEIALVADHEEPVSGRRERAEVSRLSRQHGSPARAALHGQSAATLCCLTCRS